MATDIDALVVQALAVQRQLAARGLAEEATVVATLIQELAAARPETTRPYYTVSEAATLVGVSRQTIKNWIARGLLEGSRLGGRYIIPRGALSGMAALAEASQAIGPLPDRETIIEAIRAGRKPVLWPPTVDAQ